MSVEDRLANLEESVSGLLRSFDKHLDTALSQTDINSGILNLLKESFELIEKIDSRVEVLEERTGEIQENVSDIKEQVVRMTRQVDRLYEIMTSKDRQAP